MIIVTTENPEIKEKVGPLDGAKACMNALLEEAGEEQKKILLLLSGGSSLEILAGINEDLISPAVTICPLDERYSTNPEENNMGQIDQTDFFRKARENGAGMIDTRVLQGESQENLAKRFNQALLDWLKENPDGKIVATVGVGADGHVSGMMPYPENPQKFYEMFDGGNTEKLVVGYDAGDKNQYPLRATTTMNLIRKIDVAVCYVAGNNKKEAVLRLLSEEGDLATTPARILREIPGKVFLFTDQN